MGKARGGPRAVDFRVAIADSVPKSIAYRLLEPALGVPGAVRLICHEGNFEDLLGQLSVHKRRPCDRRRADGPHPQRQGVQPRRSARRR